MGRNIWLLRPATTLNQKVEGSIPSALTTFKINNLDKTPAKFSNFPHTPLPLSSSLSLVFSMTYIRRRATDAQSVVRFRMWADLLIIQQHALLPKALWLKCGCVVIFFIPYLCIADDPIAADAACGRLIALDPD